MIYCTLHIIFLVHQLDFPLPSTCFIQTSKLKWDLIMYLVFTSVGWFSIFQRKNWWLRFEYTHPWSRVLKNQRTNFDVELQLSISCRTSQKNLLWNIHSFASSQRTLSKIHLELWKQAYNLCGKQAPSFMCVATELWVRKKPNPTKQKPISFKNCVPYSDPTLRI